MRALRDDKGGGEYMGQPFIEFCTREGIHRQHTEPDEPHQNGVAERANRSIAEGSTALLAQSKLPASFWAHAVSTFVHTRNRMPTTSLKGGIPYTAWKGDKRKPDVSYFRVFWLSGLRARAKEGSQGAPAAHTKVYFCRLS